MANMSINYRMDKQNMCIQWKTIQQKYIYKLLICAIWMNLKSVLNERSLI